MATLYMFILFAKLVTYLKIVLMCLSGSGVSQQQGEKLIPWIHLLILLGITWDTLTLTTLTGKVQMQGHLVGKPTLQNRREERRRTEARYA